MLIHHRARFVMIGDSITDNQRTRPNGEGLFDPYGQGYVNFVQSLIGAKHPDAGIRFTNMGESGNTVRNLKERWERDVIALQPDWLSVCIGINDVWRQFDLPDYKEKHISPEEYESTLDELLSLVAPSLKGLVLATPYFIEPNKSDPMRKRMDEYGRIVQRIAARYDALFVDLQQAFDDVLQYQHPMKLSWDRVHPNAVGHMVIALAFLKVLQFEL